MEDVHLALMSCWDAPCGRWNIWCGVGWGCCGKGKRCVLEEEEERRMEEVLVIVDGDSSVLDSEDMVSEDMVCEEKDG